jgi:hypothetical protein
MQQAANPYNAMEKTLFESFRKKISDQPPRDIYNAAKWNPKSVEVGVVLFQPENECCSSHPSQSLDLERIFSDL